MTVILGFDPGSFHCGFCRLETRGGEGSPINTTLLAKGTVESSYDPVAKLLSPVPDVVAIEKLEGHTFGGRAGIVKHLVASSSVAGGIAWLARALGIRVVEMSALEWRRIVLGKGGATDIEIATVIPRLVYGWPKKSNVHERDAGGCALGVGWYLGGRNNR